MIGFVDEAGRALLEIRVSSARAGDYLPVEAWIDTAFDGHLVFSRELVEELGLDTLAESEAILADGSKVSVETFICFVEWFGDRFPVQVIAGEGKFPLLGIGLLWERILTVNYSERVLSLT